MSKSEKERAKASKRVRVVRKVRHIDATSSDSHFDILVLLHRKSF